MPWAGSAGFERVKSCNDAWAAEKAGLININLSMNFGSLRATILVIAKSFDSFISELISVLGGLHGRLQTIG